MHNKPLWLTIIGFVIWGIMPIYWKTLSDVGAMYTLCARVVFSMVASLVAITATRKWNDVNAVLHNKRQFWLTALAGLLICINWGIFILATQIGHITEAAIGGYLVPLLMMLSGSIFFKEKLNKLEYGAVAFAAVGVLYMIIAVGVVPYMAIIMACAFTGYGCMKKLTGLESNLSMAVETLSMTPFALAYIIWAEMTGHGAAGVLSGWAWLLLPGGGLFTFIPLYMFGYGVTKLRYAVVGMIQYLCPTIQLLIGIFIYGEVFTTMHLITFIFIWLAVMCFIAGQQLKSRREKAAAKAASHSMAA